MATDNSKKPDIQKNSGLKKCFSALVDRKQVNLDIDVLRLMLKHELLVNVEALDDNLSSIMPFMLVLYIRNWPGWQRSKEYYSGKLNFREWFEKFRQFIVVRLNFLIKNGYNEAIEMIKEDRKQGKPNSSFRELGAQTDYLAPKGLAPFSISIQCPPRVLSSLVFSDSNDDIILRQHPDVAWTKIGLKELVNWPYIGVEFISPELSFRRFNRSEYIRYLNMITCPIVPEKTDFIEHVEIIDPSNGRHCYTLNLLKSYTDQYMKIMKSTVFSGPPADIEVMEVIIDEFLSDIEELDMNKTMASNTSVLFNIGRSSFLRNKKIAKGTYFVTGSKAEVGYCENFIPKMETQLNYFKGVQDTSTNDITFSYLNILSKTLKNPEGSSGTTWTVPLIIFYCTFCNLKYTKAKDILQHLEMDHKMEPNIMCVKCMKHYTITSLTQIRWKHVCYSGAGQFIRPPPAYKR
ncbi:unnamed protein product [Phaedon cochleariae]|uniref:C2H2-type domain-containing protein n=1 Tax=Phaedon cochleariae TaxID=80249 RepID=A0A9N9X3N2_PHACE|nr:unnamed protein product [Phaedon cochleariae]